MKKVSQIPIAKNSSGFLKVAARFEYFNGECWILVCCDEHCRGKYYEKLIGDDSSCADRMRCTEIEPVAQLLNCRLTYNVRVLEKEYMHRDAKLVLVLFTDREVLGCVKVKIPDIPFNRRDDEWVTGHIDFVPL